MEKKEKVVHETMQRVYKHTRIPTANDLAQELNIDPQMVYNWDRRGISKLGLDLIRDRYKLSSDWVKRGVGAPTINAASKPIKAWIPVKSYSKMGDNGYFDDMGYLGDGGDGYINASNAGPFAYAIRGNGDSMFPEIRHGWYAVCDPEAQPTPTEFVEVRFVDGKRTIKEFIGIQNNILHLLAINGSQKLTFDMRDVSEIIAIIGIYPPSQCIPEIPDV